MALGMHFNVRIVSAVVAVAAVAVTPLALAGAAPVAATPANAPSPATRAQLTLVVGTVLSPPHVVLGADNRQHLAHELQLLNTAPFPVKLKRLDTIDPATGVVLQSLRGAGLTALVKRPEGAPFDGTLGAGLSGIVILDATLPKNAPLPANLTHRITLGFTLPPGFPALPKVYTLGRTTVRPDRPIVIGRPLRGARWVAVNGCCDALTAHRGGIVPVNGRLVAPERFAIDFVQLDRQRRLFSGPVGQLSGYPGYGEQVLSVAAGTVVGTHDGEPDQIPPNVPPFSLDTAGGNWVVVDIGSGHFAFYAHLQPHSLTVTTGDRVRRGQVLGLLGNSGNSTAPHLHFHIMDGPSTPVADSLPYEFADFTSAGTVTDENALFNGLPTPIGPQLAGSHHHQLPLNLQVMDFH
jgi:peptidase M23-like protein